MRLVLALSRDGEETVLSAAIVDGHEIVARPASSSELVSALGALRPDAALVGARPTLLTPSVLAAADAAGVHLVGVIQQAGDRENAAALGLRETVDSGASWSVMHALLEDAPLPPVAPPRPAAGVVVSVWGPTGAPGRTTVATSVAAELAAEGHRVALADADVYGGAVALRLGLLDEAPGFAAACRLAATGGLDGEQLERVSVPVATRAGSLRVLTGLAQPARWPELSDERVDATLAAFRGWVDAAVVDVGFNLESDEEIVSDLFAPRRNAATLAAVRGSDHVVAVGHADAVGIARLLRGYSQLRELVPAERISVVVNRVRGAALGTGAGRQIAAALDRFAGIPSATLVPDDASALDAAALKELPLPQAAPKSPARAALRRHVGEHVVPLLGNDTAARREALVSVSRFAPSR